MANAMKCFYQYYYIITNFYLLDLSRNDMLAHHISLQPSLAKWAGHANTALEDNAK